MQGTQHEQLERSWGHFKKYKPLVKELVSRDLKVKYRRSFLGYVWSVLNPLLMMLLQSLIFSFMFRNDIPNFPLYLICGNTLFTFFNESTNMGLTSIIFNGTLIKKVYIPKFIFPLSRVVSSFVTMWFSFAAILLVMVFTRAPFYWTILLCWVPLLFLFLFSCGMAMALSALTVYFRDMQHLYSILTLGWMYATPLFYPLEQLPAFMQRLMKFNPMYHYVNMFRNLVMYGNIPGPNTWFACIVSAVGMMAIGLVVFRKLQRNFILYI
ncbi:MAG: ABC transporter permease [Gemmiger sp.]|nr:ABC transporter permease [Gemmiger sp.]